MTKVKKRKSLQVGERIWIESTPMFYEGDRKIHEYEIVEANSSSAYAVRVEDLGEKKALRKRIEQRTGKIVNSISIGYAYYLWESKEAFENSLKRQEETIRLRKEAIEKVKEMNLEQLQAFLHA